MANSVEFRLFNLQEEGAEDSCKIIKKGKIICAFCRGEGQIKGGICPVCSGRKKIKIWPPAIVCRKCSGWGSYPMNSQSPCITCGGAGVVSVELPIEDCPHCRGTGMTPSGLSCTKCSGKGVVKARGQKKNSDAALEKVLSDSTILIKKS